MYIYVGKLNWFGYAENECITIVFPAGFALKDPVCTRWQWTVDSNDNKKSNNTEGAFISSVTKTNSEYRLRIQFNYYAFEGTVSNNFKSLSLTMSNPQGETASFSLLLQLGDAVRVPSVSVFTGKINWYQHIENEMVTLIIVGDVDEDKRVFLSSQWTIDSGGNYKTNYTVNGKMTAVNLQSNGNWSARFSDGYYTFDFTVDKANNNLVLSMTNPVRRARLESAV